MQLSHRLWRPVCATPPEQSSGQGGRTTGPSILLAEDDGAVRSLLARVLRSRSYQVAEADDGAAALALAEKTTFDLLVTDVMMPRLSGPDLVAHLRDKGHRLPVIYITGYANAILDTSAVFVVLRKPFSPATLLDAVKQALDVGK